MDVLRQATPDFWGTISEKRARGTAAQRRYFTTASVLITQPCIRDGIEIIPVWKTDDVLRRIVSACQGGICTDIIDDGAIRPGVFALVNRSRGSHKQGRKKSFAAPLRSIQKRLLVL